MRNPSSSGATSFEFYLAYRRIPSSAPGDDWNELTDGLMVESLARMTQYQGSHR
jgi:hypothetical protein